MPPNSKRAALASSPAGVKKKDGAFTRTGQACDRCKLRKIRCDARLGGCSPCLVNNSECKTTDRITGRATARGHTETLESENTSLKRHLRALQQQLREQGVEPKAAPNGAQLHISASSAYLEHNASQDSWADTSGDGSFNTTSTFAARAADRKTSQASLLPDFRPGCIGDNYLGVSSGNGWLSPIEGTCLALFGMKIDVAEFLPPESDSMASPLSYRTFLAHALGKSNPVNAPPLPSFEELTFYADWYFKSIQIFVPVLHRPEFLKLISDIFHAQYQPNPAETVMLHMVVAILRFQLSLRNGADPSNDDYMQHYHYSLSLIPDLITGHTLQDIQALVLICAQLRAQPRPGAAWMFINAVFGICVEIGLHRSADNWQDSASGQDPHTVEMRKRIFWTILVLHVGIGGKLGRPMPIRLEDIDIEIPEPQPDNMPYDSHLSAWQKCSFRAAIQGFKLLQILMQVYATIYAIRSSPEPYDATVASIEKQLKRWKDDLPAELSCGPDTVDEDITPALYLELTVQFIRLVLHHPSLCRTISPQLLANNADVCLDACGKTLALAMQLKNLNALDTTWMQTTDFLAAIFTTLFVHTQRSEQISSRDLHQLRRDMDSWLDVMGEAGSLLGAGSRLREAVRLIVDRALGIVARRLPAENTSGALASASLPNTPTDGSSASDLAGAGAQTNGHHHPNHGLGMPHVARSSFSGSHSSAEQAQSYPPAPPVYPDTQAQPLAQYHPNTLTQFNTSVFDTKANVDTQLNHAQTLMPQQQTALQQPHHHPAGPNGTPYPLQTPQQAYLYSTPPPPPQHQNTFHHPDPHQPLDMLNSGPAAWRTFADSMMTNMGGMGPAPSDFMHAGPGNPLMGMGGDAKSLHPVDVVSAGGGPHTNGVGVGDLVGGLQIAGAPPPWPLSQMGHFTTVQGNGH